MVPQMRLRVKKGACSLQPSWALAALGWPPCTAREATITQTEQAVQPGMVVGQLPTLGRGSMQLD